MQDTTTTRARGLLLEAPAEDFLSPDDISLFVHDWDEFEGFACDDLSPAVLRLAEGFVRQSHGYLPRALEAWVRAKWGEELVEEIGLASWGW